MAPRKPPIPDIPRSDPQWFAYLASLKANVELLTGVRGGTLDQLTSSASLSDVISKINEIITRLNK